MPHSRRRTTHRVVAHRSGVHRLACLALYRLLLRQVRTSPLQQPLLRSVLRDEFRKDARLRIHADIRQSLTTGYKTLALLQSLQGQPPISKQVASLNAHLHSLAQQSTISSSAAAAAAKAKSNAKTPSRPAPLLTPFPGGNRILDRPLPSSLLSGKRHVPKLVDAGGFPMLRVKKPQPPLLSKIIRDKIVQRQRRTDAISFLEQDILPWAEDEDAWDAAVGLRKRGEGSYATTTNECIRHVHGLLAAEYRRQTELARKFWRIVLEERRLAGEEMQREKDAKIQAWINRVKAARERAGVPWEDRTNRK